jgi:hypothetical protein
MSAQPRLGREALIEAAEFDPVQGRKGGHKQKYDSDSFHSFSDSETL